MGGEVKGPPMPLTEIAARNAKPREKDWEHTDEKGLYLLIAKAGGMLLRRCVPQICELAHVLL